MIWPDNLNSNRQPLVAEPCGNGERWTTRHGDREDRFHPFMVGFHRFACNLLRPMFVDVEWEKLSRGNDEKVVFFKKSSNRAVPFRAHDRCCGNLESREFQAAFN